MGVKTIILRNAILGDEIRIYIASIDREEFINTTVKITDSIVPTTFIVPYREYYTVRIRHRDYIFHEYELASTLNVIDINMIPETWHHVNKQTKDRKITGLINRFIGR